MNKQYYYTLLVCVKCVEIVEELLLLAKGAVVSDVV